MPVVQGNEGMAEAATEGGSVTVEAPNEGANNLDGGDDSGYALGLQ